MGNTELFFVLIETIKGLMLLYIQLQGVIESKLREVLEENFSIGIATFLDILIKGLFFRVKITLKGRKELEHTCSGTRGRDKLENVQAVFLLLVGGHILNGIFSREREDTATHMGRSN